MLEDLHHPIKILHAPTLPGPTLPGPFPSWIFHSRLPGPTLPGPAFMDLPFWMSPKRKAQQEGAACDSRRVALSLFDFFKSPLRMNATNILYDCHCHLLIFCPNYIQAPCNSALGKYQLRPFTPPPLPRSLLCPHRPLFGTLWALWQCHEIFPFGNRYFLGAARRRQKRFRPGTPT